MAGLKLDNRVAIVTGAASGIGRGIAGLFAGEGARVAAVDRDASALKDTAAAIARAGGTVVAHAGDVADAGDVRSAAAAVIDDWGRIDVLVTAAGISTGGTVTTTDEAEWDRVFAVNVRGTFLWIREAVPHMAAAGGGAIVTIASQLALAGGSASAPYVASKGAVLALTKSVALDYAGQGIRANVLLPGAIETPMLERSLARRDDPAAARRRSQERHAMGRFGTVEEVARAALYLASDDASFTTGLQMAVDGGWLVA